MTTSAKNKSFSDCTSLERIYISDSVVTFGIGAFASCESLTDIYCQTRKIPNGWKNVFAQHNSDLLTEIHWGYESDIFKAPTFSGDINGNGSIDALDYILLKRAYFGTYTLTCDLTVADINNSSVIDAMDYILLKRAYFGTYII